jgi:hypothetical protein
MSKVTFLNFFNEYYITVILLSGFCLILAVIVYKINAQILKNSKLGIILINEANLLMYEQYTALDLRFNTWVGSQEQVDDVLVIGVKI